MGVQRVLEASESGRGFLQEHGLRFENPPDYNNYFASLKSERRRDLAREVNCHLIATVEAMQVSVLTFYTMFNDFGARGLRHTSSFPASHVQAVGDPGQRHGCLLPQLWRDPHFPFVTFAAAG
jgi:hypothetical protein